jgi:fatty-acyl-CoA synthase
VIVLLDDVGYAQFGCHAGANASRVPSSHTIDRRAHPRSSEGTDMATPVISPDWLAYHARSQPNALAIVDVGTSRRFTYTQLNDRAERLAAVLSLHYGIEAGDRVAIYSLNTTDIFEVQFACWKLGAAYVPLNSRLALPELEFIVGDCTPKVLFHESEGTEIATALAASSNISARICWNGESQGAASYEELLDSVGPSAVFARARNTHDVLACVMYTSGTTGRPKGAIITHAGMAWNLLNATAPFGFRSGMVNLSILPLFHIGGINAFANPAFHYGGTSYVTRAFDPGLTLQLLGDPEIGITHFLAVPSNYLFMSQHPAFETATFPTLITAGIGGAPTPRALLDAWAEKGVILQQGYGMTESAATISAQSKRDAIDKVGSIGTPLLHLEHRIVDEHCIDVEPGAIGELWVRAPNISPGYWNRPDANEDSYTDGWFHTGDAIREDEDGALYILDRWKDMYISGGENVYPAEVENVIYQLDSIGEVAVIGVPDDRWGEVGKAVVVLKPGATVTDAEVVAHCVKNLAKFKVPKVVAFVDALPHNATGKILKRELR